MKATGIVRRMDARVIIPPKKYMAKMRGGKSTPHFLLFFKKILNIGFRGRARFVFKDG